MPARNTNLRRGFPHKANVDGNVSKSFVHTERQRDLIIAAIHQFSLVNSNELASVALQKVWPQGQECLSFPGPFVRIRTGGRDNGRRKNASVGHYCRLQGSRILLLVQTRQQSQRER